MAPPLGAHSFPGPTRDHQVPLLPSSLAHVHQSGAGPSKFWKATLSDLVSLLGVRVGWSQSLSCRKKQFMPGSPLLRCLGGGMSVSQMCREE